MKTFQQYLTEVTNTHMTHVEDLVLLNGIDGARASLRTLSDVCNMLAGTSTAAVNITTKFDGAPAIICGKNPENGKFFVASKSIFNKVPKVNYTEADVEANHSGGVVEKLKTALKYLSELGINNILQGDMMFSKKDLKVQNIDGESCVTFRPNTILYAVPKTTALAREIMGAQMGIVFHTEYNGKSLTSLSASFGADVSGLRKSRNVWVSDAFFRDVSGSATFTSAEFNQVRSIMSTAGRLFRGMSKKVATDLATVPKYQSLVSTYINAKVREGVGITSGAGYALGLIDWAQTKSKDPSVEQYFKENVNEISVIFQFQSLLTSVKELIIDKLKQVKGLGTFFETSSGEFEATTPEGFVAINDNGSAVKIVDRLSFSRANFNIEKNW